MYDPGRIHNEDFLRRRREEEDEYFKNLEPVAKCRRKTNSVQYWDVQLLRASAQKTNHVTTCPTSPTSYRYFPANGLTCAVLVEYHTNLYPELANIVGDYFQPQPIAKRLYSHYNNWILIEAKVTLKYKEGQAFRRTNSRVAKKGDYALYEYFPPNVPHFKIRTWHTLDGTTYREYTFSVECLVRANESTVDVPVSGRLSYIPHADLIEIDYSNMLRLLNPHIQEIKYVCVKKHLQSVLDFGWRTYT